MSNVSQPLADPYLERMKAARNAPSVLKLQLATIRSDLPNVIVFAVEGDDDKIIYFQWISRVRPGLTHEYLVCRNKLSVLMLSESLTRDRTTLARNVYFFIDRDFDDMAGFPEMPSLFMTDRYSVENYLVDNDVLDAVLKVEFHCQLKPHIRAAICHLFQQVRTRFLEITREHNLRVFVAKKSGIPFSRTLPNKINPLAIVELQSVDRASEDPDQVIVLEREPTSEEWSRWAPMFDQLSPKDRYRGKFLIAFFRRWLEKLYEEYKSTNASTVFLDLDRKSNARFAELVLGTFASRSSMPVGLAEFSRLWG